MEVINKINKYSFNKFCLLLIFVFIFCISFFRKNYFFNDFENFSLIEMRLVLILFIFVLLFYFLLFIDDKLKISSISIFFIITISFVAFVTPPVFSRDIGAYLLGANNMIKFHVNPYLISLNGIKDNNWLVEFGDVWWLKYHFSYGPIFLIFASISVLPNFINLIDAVYFYKFLIYLVYFASIFLFYKIVKILALNESLIILYALNPAILINGLIDGHNEMLIIITLLLSVLFLIKDKREKSYFFWIISVFVKYNTIILMPIFWMEKNKLSIKRIIFSVVGVVISFFIALEISNLDIKNYLNNFMIIKGQLQGCLYRCFPIASLTDLIAGKYGSILRTFLFLLVYSLFFLKFIIKKTDYIKFMFWSSISLVFISVKWISPWYVLPAITIGLLIPERNYRVLVFILTTYSLLHFFGII